MNISIHQGRTFLLNYKLPTLFATLPSPLHVLQKETMTELTESWCHVTQRKIAEYWIMSATRHCQNLTLNQLEIDAEPAGVL